MAHRNQDLQNTKCARPHGHFYKIFMHFHTQRNGNISTLFEDFDKHIEPLLKDEYDHRMLIDKNDPLFDLLKKNEDAIGDLGLKVMPFATSVENLCFFLFHEVKGRFSLPICELHIQETQTSTVVYTQVDYLNDLRSFYDLAGKPSSYTIYEVTSR